MLKANIWIVTKRPEHWAEIGWEQVEETIWTSLDKLEGYPEIQLDLETTGLGSFMTERVNSVALGTPDFQYVYDVERDEDAAVIWPALKKFLHLRKDKVFVGQNLNFDLPYFYARDIVLLRLYDTMLAEQVLNNGVIHLKNDLGSIVYRHLGTTLDKSRQKDISGGLRAVEDVLYAGSDVLYLSDVKASQEQLAIKRQVVAAVELENQFVRVLAYLEFSGVGFNTDRWLKKCRRDEYLEYRQLLILNKEITQHFSADELAEINALDKEGEINWLSPSQVGEILRRLGVDITHPKSKKQSVDIKFLRNIQDQHVLIPIYIKFRQLNKIVTTYGRKYIDFPFKDGRIHTKYRQFMETGRTSSGAEDHGKFPFPNLQNQPKDEETRRSYCAQGANTLVVCDYGSQESVILADLSGDKDMLNFFESGEGDIHSYTARKLWPKDLGQLSIEEIAEHHPDRRKGAKEANFAIAYGGNGRTIAFNLGVKDEVGEEVYRLWFEGFPTIKEYMASKVAFAFKYGYIPLCKYSGRKRYVGGFKEWRAFHDDRGYWERYRHDPEFNADQKERVKKHMKIKSAITNAAMNGEIQGTAATMSKLAGIAIFEWILKVKKFGIVKLPLFVHDEWVVECNQRVAEKVAVQIEKLMIEAGSKILKNLDIKVSTKISKTWSK